MTAPLVGIDLIEPTRLQARLDRSPALAQELFHPGELEYSETQPSRIESLASRFAAKEAVIKALGIDGFEPLDVEVLDGGERCAVRLHGAAADRARELDVVVTISMSHVKTLAIAIAMARPAGDG